MHYVRHGACMHHDHDGGVGGQYVPIFLLLPPLLFVLSFKEGHGSFGRCAISSALSDCLILRVRQGVTPFVLRPTTCGPRLAQESLAASFYVWTRSQCCWDAFVHAWGSKSKADSVSESSIPWSFLVAIPRACLHFKLIRLFRSKQAMHQMYLMFPPVLGSVWV